jgi:hypothetical protein
MGFERKQTSTSTQITKNVDRRLGPLRRRTSIAVAVFGKGEKENEVFKL